MKKKCLIFRCNHSVLLRVEEPQTTVSESFPPLAAALSPSFDNINSCGHFDLHSFETLVNSLAGTGGELVPSVCGLP